MNQSRQTKHCVPFKPETEDERKVARIARMMLNYWILRTMIERARQHDEPVSKLMVDNAKAVRLEGFREEFRSNVSVAPGQPVFDDEKLKQAGTRIAYLLPTVRANFAVGEPDRAEELLAEVQAIEEEIVTLEVYRALAGIDVQQVRIAA